MKNDYAMRFDPPVMGVAFHEMLLKAFPQEAGSILSTLRRAPPEISTLTFMILVCRRDLSGI